MNTFKTDPLANERYEKMIDARVSRLQEALEIQPHTGHKPGHKYPKG